jgi:hypothetical protein
VSNCPVFWSRVKRDRLSDDQHQHAAVLRETAADLAEASSIADRIAPRFGLGVRLRELIPEAVSRRLSRIADFLEGTGS